LFGLSLEIVVCSVRIQTGDARLLIGIREGIRRQLGTPDCDWGHEMHGLSEDQFNLCYSEFKKHCLQRHGVEEWDSEAHVHLDLEKCMLTLIKT
jgi:hypothetical protein